MLQPFLKGKCVDLRPITRQELADYYINWFNDADVTRNMVKGDFPLTHSQQEDYFNNVIESRNNLVLAITLTDSGKHIGNIGLHGIHPIHRHAELGIIIGEKDQWGKGLAYEAMCLLCSHGFNMLNLNRIELGVICSHKSATNLYERIGFKQEGIRRNHIFKHGEYLDVMIMGLLRDDWDGLHV